MRQTVPAVDEPYFGYGEYSYATHLLTFGRFAAQRRAETDWLRSFLDEPGLPQVIASNSDDLLGRHDPARAIQPLVLTEASRVLYVPTSFSGINTYGPWRATADHLYWDWHRRVLEAFPEARLKAHPNDPYWRAAEAEPERLVGGSLAQVMDQADVFVFDYLSTAFAQAAGTHKPIIYLDIGLRHPTEAAWDAIQRRCVVISDAARLDAEGLRRAVLAASSEGKENRYTPLFSLNGTDQPRMATLIDQIRRVLNP